MKARRRANLIISILGSAVSVTGLGMVIALVLSFADSRVEDAMVDTGCRIIECRPAIEIKER